MTNSPTQVEGPCISLHRLESVSGGHDANQALELRGGQLSVPRRGRRRVRDQRLQGREPISSRTDTPTSRDPDQHDGAASSSPLLSDPADQRGWPVVTPDDFNATFDSFRTSAFRLECRQTYKINIEDARLRAFRQGKPRPERSIRTDPWLRRIAETTLAGKSWSRVRLIQRPLTEYTRYELISFVESQAVGEQIQILDLDEHPDLTTLGPDFLLFDAGEPDQSAIALHYDDEGSVLGYEHIDPEYCREQATVALASSIHLAEFLARRDAR